MTLSSNQFTLPPGVYKLDILVPAFGVDYSQAILWSTTNGAIFEDAASLVVNGLTNITQIISMDVPPFTLTSPHQFEVKQNCSGSGVSETHAGGAPSSWPGNGSSVKSIYTTVKIQKFK